MRIAHLTDLHLRHHLPGTAQVPARRSRRMPEFLERAVNAIRDARPDLLVLSGDLLDYPPYAMHDPEMQALAERDLRLIAQALEAIPCPKAVVHGNHDHAEVQRRVFGAHASDFACTGHRVLCFHDDEGDGHFPRRLGAQRERFLEALRDGDPAPQIHVQHYLIHPERNAGYPHTYREWASLRAAIETGGRVKLVLSGHLHTGTEPDTQSGVTYAAAPAFCEFPHRWRFYEVGANGVETIDQAVLSASAPRRRAVFLDRDGTINPQPSYRWGPEPFELLPGAAEALRDLQAAGYALVVVTSQSCVGQGYVTAETVNAVHDKMARLLKEAAGVELDGVYASYHAGDHAALPEFRGSHRDVKPDTGLLERAARDLHLELQGCWMIGDSATDLEAGRRAGGQSLLVRTGHGARVEAELAPGAAAFVADDLRAAAKWILKRDRSQ